MKFTLLVLALVLATCYAQSNHAQWGYINYNDTLVYSNYIEKSSRPLLVVEEQIVFPPKGVINLRPITAIRAWDQNVKGNGANATIVGGGLNGNSVTLKFVSKRGHSVKFNVEIYTTGC